MSYMKTKFQEKQEYESKFVMSEEAEKALRDMNVDGVFVTIKVTPQEFSAIASFAGASGRVLKFITLGHTLSGVILGVKAQVDANFQRSAKWQEEMNGSHR